MSVTCIVRCAVAVQPDKLVVRMRMIAAREKVDIDRQVGPPLPSWPPHKYLEWSRRKAMRCTVASKASIPFPPILPLAGVQHLFYRISFHCGRWLLQFSGKATQCCRKSLARVPSYCNNKRGQMSMSTLHPRTKGPIHWRENQNKRTEEWDPMERLCRRWWPWPRGRTATCARV